MKEIIGISLENEMDLVLAHRRSMQIGEQLGLTIATRTTFATAVSEVARTVIEYTNNGYLRIIISGEFPRFSLKSKIEFNSEQAFRATDEGFFYAKKLLPDFQVDSSLNAYIIQMGLGLPRSLKLDDLKVFALKAFFDEVPPLNAYEEIKNKNSHLNRLTTEQEEEIRIVKALDEKKNEFISVASHEIKTPITIIKAYAQMLRHLKGHYDEKVSQVVEKLDLQISKLARLAHQLMDVSKMENGSLQYDLIEVDLNQFLADTINMLSNVYAGNPIALDLGNSCMVKADPLRLEQVLTNLLGNAVKYSSRNSPIEVKTILVENKNNIIIQVTDHGLGMSQSGINHIFDKFYRLEEIISSHPGLGMGLYISSKIIADHGGKIWVESVLNEGSSFYFSLPICTTSVIQ
nr:sensor histidine kinase [Pedobacter sp. ASV2]